MVGVFSRFPTYKIGHKKRTQIALEERKVLPQESEITCANVDASGFAHGVEVGGEFKPLEHPTEPLDNDKPVQCPLPEPSILNDGRIWKDRVTAANARRKSDLTLMREGPEVDSEIRAISQPAPEPNSLILPSLSAPEHNLVTFLEEYNASGSNKYT